MPYYLYRVTQVGPVKQLEKITEFGFFKHASAEAKRLRQASDLPAGTLVKVIFAENELQAEDLLGQVREAGPSGDD